MAVILFSYSHADEALRDWLEKSLAMLKRQGPVEAFHDRRIPPGDLLDDSIDAGLEQADLVLLLVRPDFLASDYCYGRELTRALERAASGEAAGVIPVVLRPCEWLQMDLQRFMALPTDGKPVTKFTDPDDAFLDIGTVYPDLSKVLLSSVARSGTTLTSTSHPSEAARRQNVRQLPPAGPRRSILLSADWSMLALAARLS